MFFYLQNHYLVSSRSEEKVFQMCISCVNPEVVAPIEQMEQVEEIEQPIVEEETLVEKEPVVEPEIIKEEPEVKEEVIPEPIVQKIIPKPVVKEVKKKPKVKKKVKKKIAKKTQPRLKASSRKSQRSTAEKNKFLDNIRTKINKHKSYPRIAKKRGMQGTVNVKFTILGNGKVGNISVSGPKVFHNSARNAVKSAFPINVNNAPISLPKSINITLRYQIR
ncbi:energy transducer TonB [Sulfurovum sp.]|uniref:energy transducer TonB n=1 Tax=Sulfurovum sp. TaxID=1969726 RepID=UPI00356AE3F0